jgi:hypothetical protein
VIPAAGSRAATLRLGDNMRGFGTSFPALGKTLTPRQVPR